MRTPFGWRVKPPDLVTCRNSVRSGRFEAGGGAGPRAWNNDLGRIDMHAAALRNRSVAAVSPLAVLAPASSAVASSGVKCHNNDSYGSTCISITGDGLQVRDIQAYFVPPNRDYLSHRRWAFELTRYPCDPRGRPFSQCNFNKHWISKPRRGNPPKNSSFCQVLTPQGVGVGVSGLRRGLRGRE